jgi:hypothetical protein
MWPDDKKIIHIPEPTARVYGSCVHCPHHKMLHEAVSYDRGYKGHSTLLLTVLAVEHKIS